MLQLTAGGDTVTLPSPERGNPIQSKTGMRYVRTMAGTVHTYRKPVHKKMNWEFDIKKCPADLRDEVETFYQNHFGEDVTVTDHNNRVYIGRLMSNPLQFIEGKESYNLTLEFQE